MKDRMVYTNGLDLLCQGLTNPLIVHRLYLHTSEQEVLLLSIEACYCFSLSYIVYSLRPALIVRNELHAHRIVSYYFGVLKKSNHKCSRFRSSWTQVNMLDSIEHTTGREERV